MPPTERDMDKRARDEAEAARVWAVVNEFPSRNNATMEDLMAGLRQFTEDTLYLDSIRDSLMEKYPNFWIAIYRKEIVAVAPTQQELSKKVSGKGLRLGDIARDFLDTNPPILIL